MTRQELISDIIAKEWAMFHSVNGDDRTDCQDDYAGFVAMRGAQYAAWDEATLESYHADVSAAADAGRNLAREKYIRMMRFADPEGYARFAGELPAPEEGQQALVEEIWAHMLKQTERFREEYPGLGVMGRPLLSDADDEIVTSVQTYETGELMTYSRQTLERYLAHLLALEAEGVDLVRRIQENSILCLGYPSLKAAEKAAYDQVFKSLGMTTGCVGDSCSAVNEFLADM
jgi:hypothetical protein